MNKSLKIIVGYHKPSVLFRGDCFYPMWGGASINTYSKDGILSNEELLWLQNNCHADNIGDNISEHNRNYCEATYLYWMWKNYDKLGNPDFIGFLQYRCHWVLKNEYIKTHPVNKFYNIVGNKVFTNDYQYKIGLTEYNIKKLLESYDAIFCESNMGISVYEYKKRHFSQDIRWWDLTLEIIKSDWPQFYSFAKRFSEGECYSWKNSFIMRRTDFLEYCEFLFDVLKKIDDTASSEYNNMTAEEARVPAYVSETMLGIWSLYLKNNKIRVANIPMCLVEQPFISTILLPKTVKYINKDNIPIVFVSDKNYIKYTSVTIQSIIENSSRCKSLDFIILEDGSISELQKKRLQAIAIKNCSVRFFNASWYFDHYRFVNFFHKRLNLIPYLKCFIHEILHDYSKVIFLDSDILVIKDINKLFTIDLENNLIAAGRDYVLTKVVSRFWKFRRSYIQNNNKMIDVNNYINSGVLVMDLQAMRTTPELTNRFINEARYIHNDRLHHDQDVFNFTLEGKIKLFSQKFNYQTCLLHDIHINNIPTTIRKELLDLYNSDDITILHYDGDDKPWNIKECSPLKDLWWTYARKSPFYNDIIIDVIKMSLSTKQSFGELILKINKYNIKLIRYKLIYNIFPGAIGRKYKYKYNTLKNKINKLDL